ncbi:MAG: hypothetical protein FJW23_04180 [Acidimicrobiia bacterium]|nr:hypothetical protein [Acidimicrobiia bacterium]
MRRRRRYPWTGVVVVAIMGVLLSPGAWAQPPAPTAFLSPAPRLQLTGDVDSNSPVLWEVVDGQPRLFVLTSTAGAPSVSAGPQLMSLSAPAAVGFVSHPGHGVWMEAVVRDEVGTWYGYYHNEVPADLCGRPDLVLPRIGAARSFDQGVTWEDLGIVLEAPPGWHICATSNQYFVGGVGDFSVVLDRNGQDLYFFFSQYSAVPEAQGVAVARMLWADRDAPVGRVAVWADGVWQPPALQVDEAGELGEAVTVTWLHRAGTPLVPAEGPWHDEDPANAVFWGASVHWNRHLGQYVMLLNRARDERWGQEGIYVAFAAALDDPSLWTAPRRLLGGGRWYPQVIGLEVIEGTDKEAGARARFFMSGVSTHYIHFRR